MPALPDWARAHGTPSLHGRIRRAPADFQVTEIIDYEFTGDGEHDFLWLEKTGANTAWVAGQLARHAGIRESDVGFAGLKDRHAVTRQWFSVRRPGAAGTDWSTCEIPGVRLLEQRRHTRKLRRGAHRGNRFRVALTELQGDRSQLAERLEDIRQKGVPNYFGEQRFGRGANNLALAEQLFAGRKLRRNQRGHAISAARSWLFNHGLQARVAAGSWNQLLPGDCVCLEGSSSVFACAEPDATLIARCAELDIHPGGSLWGAGPPLGTDQALAAEQAAMAPLEPYCSGLEKVAQRSQRALRLAVTDLSWELDDEQVWLEFTLFRGGFATAVLREVLLYPQP